MTKLFSILTLTLLIIGCEQTNKSNSNTQGSLLLKKSNATEGSVGKRTFEKVNDPEDGKEWTDLLIENYINHTTNELIRLALKNKISEQWIFDQTISSDTAMYLTFQIGHHVTDNGANPRFVTDQWIYIDSITKKMYEYDLANDSLICWTK